MSMLGKVRMLLKHRREVRMAISSAICLAEGDANAAVLGGLTDEEMRAVCDWAAEDGGKTVVEVGTLFGLTAREIAGRIRNGRVIAVDNFTWILLVCPPPCMRTSRAASCAARMSSSGRWTARRFVRRRRSLGGST